MATRTFQGTNGRDDFQREQVAEKVITLLSSGIQISPMVIDGDWGTGKTEFCHKLINKFKAAHDNYRILYVDAFQADHADNPLMTILSAVMTLLPEGDEKSTLLKKALPVARFALKTVAKAAVSFVLQQNSEKLAEGLDDSLQDAANEAIDASVIAVLKDHEKAQENLMALQNTLQSIAQSSPIVIFIDELDRCRPDFAVEMLEVIKHTFEVEGLQFVLVTNTRQLKASINHRYGPQVNAQRYLDKFLKFSFCLPEFVPGRTGPGDDLLLASTEYLLKLIKNSAVLKGVGFFENNNSIYEFTESLVKINNLSLREVETFVRYLEIYQRLSKGFNDRIKFGCQLLRIFGVFTFCFSPEVSESIQKNNTDGNKLAKILGLRRMPDYKAVRYRWSHAKMLAVILAQESVVGKEEFLVTLPEDVEHWSQNKINYFASSWGETPELFSLVKEAIICLRLGNVE